MCLGIHVHVREVKDVLAAGGVLEQIRHAHLPVQRRETHPFRALEMDAPVTTAYLIFQEVEVEVVVFDKVLCDGGRGGHYWFSMSDRMCTGRWIGGFGVRARDGAFSASFGWGGSGHLCRTRNIIYIVAAVDCVVHIAAAGIISIHISVIIAILSGLPRSHSAGRNICRRDGSLRALVHTQCGFIRLTGSNCGIVSTATATRSGLY